MDYILKNWIIPFAMMDKNTKTAWRVFSTKKKTNFIQRIEQGMPRAWLSFEFNIGKLTVGDF